MTRPPALPMNPFAAVRDIIDAADARMTAAGIPPAKPVRQYGCGSCGGTGWSPLVTRDGQRRKCEACDGTGRRWLP
jgi:hypothetical protein